MPLVEPRAPRPTDAPTRLVLLGTGGGANPKATRCGYANAVVVGDAVYLVDCGEGVHRQLWRAGLTVSERFAAGRPLVRALFVTHLHADHIMDLANLVPGQLAGARDRRLRAGARRAADPGVPARARADRWRSRSSRRRGCARTVEHLWRAFAYNINLRVADEGRDNVADSIRVHEIGVRRDGYVARHRPRRRRRRQLRGGRGAADGAGGRSTPRTTTASRVSAILVQHAPVFPAFGFRFDTPHGSVVFSGDTGAVRQRRAAGRRRRHPRPRGDRRSTGSGSGCSRQPNYDAVRNHLAGSHTSPEEVGAIATRAGVRTLVLSHLVPGDLEPTDEEWEARVRPHFDGEVVCGVDLDEFALPTSAPRRPADRCRRVGRRGGGGSRRARSKIASMSGAPSKK